MQYVVQLITVLAWPVTVIVLTFVFRKNIAQVTSRLSAVSVGTVRGEFRQDLAKVEGEIQELPQQKEALGQVRSSERSELSTYDRLLQIAELSPRAAVLDAWRDVEVGTKQVVVAYGISDGRGIAGRHAINELVKKGLLPHNILSVYESLRRLRSKAAHAPEFVVGPEVAVRYIEAANDFYVMFGFLLKQAQENKHRNAVPAESA